MKLKAVRLGAHSILTLAVGTCLTAIGSSQSDPSNVALSPHGKLTSPSSQIDGRFGVSVAISGPVAVAGASLEDSSLTSPDDGRAYVFERTDNNTPSNHADDAWVLTTALPPSLGVLPPGIEFGSAVGVDADTIVVGARRAQGDEGRAYVYYRSCAGPGWIAGPVLQAPSPTAGDRFGAAVAVDGTTMVVAAPNKNILGQDAGEIYVFVRSDAGTPHNPCDDTWQLTQQFQGVAGSLFGFDLGLRGSLLVVGAPHTIGHPQGGGVNRFEGAAHIFTRNAFGTWSAVAPALARSFPAAGDEFGISVATDGLRVAVGCWKDDTAGIDAGSAHVFGPSPGGGWQRDPAINAIPSANGADFMFGRSVAFSGNQLLVGAYRDFPGVPALGAMSVFEHTGPGTWSPRERITPYDAIGGDELFATDLAADAMQVIVGQYQADEFALDSAGAAYVYELAPNMQFSTFCYGDGTGGGCPCGNNSIPDRMQGCENSWQGIAAVLGAVATPMGSDSVSIDSLLIHAHNLRPNAPALLISSPFITGGTPFFDGQLCVGPAAIKRLGQRQPGPDGTAIWGPGLGAIGLWQSGATRFFQVWFRDPIGGPCAAGSNLSNGVAVTFTP
jgi:hypothetical protein